MTVYRTVPHFRRTFLRLAEVSARARIPVKYRVCWGLLQTRKDTNPEALI